MSLSESSAIVDRIVNYWLIKAVRGFMALILVPAILWGGKEYISAQIDQRDALRAIKGSLEQHTIQLAVVPKEQEAIAALAQSFALLKQAFELAVQNTTEREAQIERHLDSDDKRLDSDDVKTDLLDHRLTVIESSRQRSNYPTFHN